MNHQLDLKIPFQTPQQAKIACNSLKPDPVLKPQELTVDYSTEGPHLNVKFAGVSDRVIRVAISSVIENLKTVVECMDEFEAL